MRPPRVSIGLPVHNGADFLWSSAQSLLTQDYYDLELVISDNASTDETESICRDLVTADNRVRYHRNAVNIGAARNYNRVFQLSRGKFFKWAAHDDECHRTMIRRCVDVLERAPDSVTMVYPLAELIDEEGNTIRSVLDRIDLRDPRPHRRLAHLIRSLSMCDPVFGLYKSEYLKRTRRIGGFFGADYVLLGELAMMGEIREVTEVLFRLRAHDGRSMKANPSNRSRAAWYDPDAGTRVCVLPCWERMVVELMKSAWRAPLSRTERLKCTLVVPSVHYWRRCKVLGGRVKRRLRT